MKKLLFVALLLSMTTLAFGQNEPYFATNVKTKVRTFNVPHFPTKLWTEYSDGSAAFVNDGMAYYFKNDFPNKVIAIYKQRAGSSVQYLCSLPGTVQKTLLKVLIGTALKKGA